MDKREVDVAIASAFKALVEDSKFSWIRKSSLLERAYCLGLYAGLRAVTDESNLKDILVRVVSDTLFARSGDDTFQSTQIGHLYNELRAQFCQSPQRSGRLADKQDTLLDDQFEQLDRLIEERDRFWRHHFEESKMLLLRLKQTGEEAGSSWQELERLLRVLALLETDYRPWRIVDT